MLNIATLLCLLLVIDGVNRVRHALPPLT